MIKVLTIAQKILRLDRHVIINWIPSHFDIRGNELADRLIELGRGQPFNALVIHPSQGLLKRRAVAAEQVGVLQRQRK